MDTTNFFMVSENDGKVVMLNPPARGQKLEREQALSLASWLLVMAGIEPDELADALKAVANT